MRPYWLLPMRRVTFNIFSQGDAADSARVLPWRRVSVTSVGKHNTVGGLGKVDFPELDPRTDGLIDLRSLE
ncbi:hypothetical protein FHS27_004913 [Rhodopirellula rubra]|uniref:Uncharacterized protein n=1 Tax=Aporhodopirellula rubra TaxID=980271 RepID=A0A7W5H6Z1_9BACT|nr:hypothetical protein [Aporhodopirellula rubra]